MSFINRDDTILMAIDFQEKLVPAISGIEELQKHVIKLAKGMNILGIPKIVTQQYTKGLGPTVAGISEALGDFEPLDKTSFSCFGAEKFAETLKAEARNNVVVCGIEAHICVEQTVLELIDEGYNVIVAADCVSSRSSYDKEWALHRMQQAGAVITTCEAVIYELLKGSKEAGFKEISDLVK